MADEIRDPGAAARHNELLGALRGLNKEFGLQRAETQRTARETQDVVRRRTPAAAREARARQGATGRAAEPPPAERVRAEENVGRAAERTLATKRRIADLEIVQGRAVRERITAEDRALRRQLQARERAILLQRQSARLIAQQGFGGAVRQAVGQRTITPPADVGGALREWTQRMARQAPTLFSPPVLAGGPRGVVVPYGTRGLGAPYGSATDRLAGQPPRFPPPRPPRPTAAGGDEPPRPPRGSLYDRLPQRQPVNIAEVARQEQLQRALGGNAEAVATYTRAMASAQARTASFDQEVQLLSRRQALAGDQMRRHGLLTTEFIAAAAQGRVTVSELGVQIGGTIAKFAGWTTAAALTYGALSALQQVATGAIESREGVQTLLRVVNNLNFDQAREQFRSLSNEFNLPIENVTKAAFEAAKVFRTPQDLQAATSASLLAAKVAELPEDTATRFLTATARGFDLEAKSLEGLVDVANQLQNQLGANAAQTLEGVAKSAGAVAAAGGGVRDLAAAVATIQLATGRTGAEAGTALRRSAEIVRRPDRRKAIQEAYGLDPQKVGYFDLIRRGQQLAERGGDVGQLAKLISTPELASGRLIPLLQRRELFRQATAEAQPDRARRSARRELRTVLGGPREEIKELGVNLQQLGSALEQSGLFTGLGLMLHALNGVLNVAEGILDIFGELPAPLRQAAGTALLLGGTLGALRRFDVGGVIAGGATGIGSPRALGRRPQSTRRAEVLQGLRDERDFITEERRTVARQEATARRREHLQTVRRDEASRTAALSPDDDNAKRTVVAEQRRLDRASRQAADLAREQADLQTRHVSLLQRENDFARATTRRGGQAVDVAASRLGIHYGSSIDPRPNPSDPYPIGLQGAAQRAAAEAQQEMLEAAERRSLVDRYQQARVSGASRLASTAATGTAALSAGRLIAARAAGQAASFATAVRAAIGPLEAGVLGILATYTAIKSTVDAVNHQRDRIAAIKHIQTQADFDAIKDARTTGDKIGNFFEAAAFFVPELVPGVNAETGFEKEDRLARQRLARINSLQRTAPDTGRGFKIGQIQKRLRDNVADGMEPQKALAQANRELDSALGVLVADTPTAKKNAANYVKLARERARLFVEALKATNTGSYDELTADEVSGVNQQRIFQGRFGGRAVRQTGRALGRFRYGVATETDSAAALELQEKVTAEQQRAEDEITRRRDAALLRARTPVRRRAVQQRYVQQLRTLRVDPIRDEIEERNRIQQRLRNQIANAELPLAGIAAATPQLQNRRLARLKALRNSLRASLRAERGLRGQLRLQNAEIDAIQREIDVGRFTDRLDAFDARTERLQSEQSTDDGKQSVLEQRLRRRTGIVRGGRRRGLQTRADVDRAIAEQNNAAQVVATEFEDNTLAILQARQGLAAARLKLSGASEQTQLSAAIGAANEYAAAVQAKEGADSPDFIGAQQAVAEAQNALREYVEAQAKEMVSARAELAVSRTDNPIRQATIRVREAKQLIRYAETPAERLRARAEVNSRQRDRSNQLLDRQVETLDFRHEVGRLTDQAWIAGMRRLLSGLTRGTEAYRDLHRKIVRAKHDIENESKRGDFELNVGNVRIPTIYDVRRQLAGGGQPIEQNLYFRSEINVHGSNDPEGTARTVLDRVDHHYKTAGKARGRMLQRR